MHYFTGVYNLNGKLIISNEITKLTDVDGGGSHIFTNQNFGVSFRSSRNNHLLSVPLFFESEDKNVLIIFEGRIYNANDLMADRREKGCFLAKETDFSELIFLLYKHYDLKFLPLLEGAYSFIIWDRKKSKLILHRDKIGLKPLYYYYKNNTFIFGTYLKALLRHPQIKKEMNVKNLCSYFFMDGLSLGAETEYEGINNLLPGHVLIVDESGARLDLVKFKRDSESSNFNSKQTIRDFYEVLEKSVNRQFEINDQAINIAFSGGLDTKVIAAFAKKTKKPIRTFTVEFDSQSETKRLDYELARAGARKIKSRHLRHKLSSEKFLSAIEPQLAAGGRLLNLNNLNGFYIFKWISQNANSVISGDGTEEQLSLYEYHMLPYYADNLIGKLPGSGAKKIYRPVLDSYCDLFLLRSWETPRNSLSEKLFKKQLFAGAAQKEALKHDTRKIFYDCWDRSPDTDFYFQKKTAAPSLFNKALWVDFHNNLCPKLLVAYDLVSRLNSVEVLLPFFDADFVSFASRIPASLKLPPASLKYKYIFREAVLGLIGDKEAFNPFKSGSDIPFEEWLVDDYFERYVREKLKASKLRKQGILNHRYVSQIVQEHYSNKNLFKFFRPDGTVARMLKDGKNHTHKILKLLGFQLWLENNF